MQSEMGVPVAIPPKSASPQTSLSMWLLSWFAEASDDEKAVQVQGVYALWLARNNAREGQRIEEAEAIARRVWHLMEEWQSIHGRKSKQVHGGQRERWKPPDDGWTKANVDGATSKVGELGGAGVVFRNQEGAFLGGACQVLPSCSDPIKAELGECKRVAQLAAQLDVQNLHIEMDCAVIVGKLRSQEKDLSPHGPTIEEIKQLLNSRERWKISWVRRSANGAAHRLARHGVTNNLCKVWLNEPPDCILQVISDDIPTWES